MADLFDPEIIKQYVSPVLWLGLGICLKALHGYWTRERIDNRTELRLNTTAIIALEKTMILVNSQIKTLTEKIDPLLRLRDDVHEAHTKIRELRQQINKPRQI